MRDPDVSVGALKRAVDELGEHFRTKDVSNHPEVTGAHQRFVSDFNYHAAVGKALSGNRRALGIELVSTAGGNALWAKSTSAVAAHEVHQPVEELAVASTEIGPQSGGDSPFAARMRFHQSWYRATVLHVPYGTGPNPSSQSHYGNMLSNSAADAGLNFLRPEIFAVARARIAQGGGVEPFRCLHNCSPASRCASTCSALSRTTSLSRPGVCARCFRARWNA